MHKRILALFFSVASLFSAAYASDTMLIPGGKSVGVTLSTDGVMVVNTGDIQTQNGKRESPAQSSGLQPGDLITSFNQTPVSSVDELLSAVSQSEGKASTLIIKRDNKTIETMITPQISSDDGTLKIGVWVKDAASGIGTMTFYNPADNTFAALGHGICDPETGNIISLDDGSILSSTIVSVEKGLRGSPGELKGVFAENSSTLGTVSKNTACGIFGTIDNIQSFSDREFLPAAARDEVTPGKASILANVEGNIVEQFDIEILRVMPQNTAGSKSMIIKITDEALLQKTGGIVQGMSGSPIIQNGKLVGAVTHVFVNDPARGYGIFIENMLNEAMKVK